MIRYSEHLPDAPQDDRGLPDLAFAFYDRMIVFDHVQKTIVVVAMARVNADGVRVEAAYDDAQGVTAEFSLNLLKRINRELGGHFCLDTFQHRARYDKRQGRIEIDLVSQKAQKIRIDSLELEIDFVEGESIKTEHCVKYSLDEIGALAAEAGLSVRRQFMDCQSRFSLNVLEFARE